MKFNTGLLFSSLLLAIKAADTTTADKTCNPLSAVCAPNPALATDIVEDFTAPSSDFEIMSTKSGVFYNDDGLQLKLSKRFDNPSVMSTFYIMFGRTELHIKAAPGKGIISSFFLQSDDLDEIDLEFVGGDDTEFQSNWFSKGNVATYDRGAFHPTQGAPQDNFGNYTILWTEDSIEWWYNGNLVRTLLPNNGQGYPQSPMKIFAGIWAGGDPDNQPGTIEWAGGETDYSQAPFSMYISKLIVNDFSTGKAYKYTDKTGSWESIEAEGGKVNGRINQANYNPSGNDHQALVSISSSSASPSSSSSSSSVVSSSVSSSVASSSSASSSSSSASSSSSSASSSASSSSASSSASSSSASKSSASASSSSKSSSSSSSTSKSSAASTTTSSTISTTTKAPTSTAEPSTTVSSSSLSLASSVQSKNDSTSVATNSFLLMITIALSSIF